MAKLVFENFTGQIPGSDIVGFQGTARGPVGALTRSVVDPNRFPNVLAPFPKEQSLTNSGSIDTTVVKMVTYVASTPLILGVGGAKVYEIVPNTNTVTNTGNFPHSVSSATMSDIVLYENNGTIEAFYSWYDATDGDIGRLSGVGSSDTFDDDYFTNVVGGANLGKNPLPMAVGDNNILYIGNGGTLVSMDLRTSSATFNDSEIDLLGGFLIKDHVSHKGYHWIAAKESHADLTADPRFPGRGGIFVWDYVSNSFSDVIFVDDNDVSRIFVHNGTLYAITSSNSRARLRKYNGSSFEPVPGVIWSDNSSDYSTVLGGISDRLGMLMWTSRVTGEVNTYGSLHNPNSGFYNQIGDVGTTMGAITKKPLSTDSYYIAHDAKVEIYDFTTTGTYLLSPFIYRSSMQVFPGQVVIKGFWVYWNSQDAGSASNSLDISARFNGSDSATAVGSVTFDKAAIGRAWIPYVKNNVFSIGLGATYTEGVTVGATCIMPYRIEVEYEATTKR